MGWVDVQRAESADNRLDFRSVSDRSKINPDSVDNRPLRDGELEQIRLLCEATPGMSWAQGKRKYLLTRPKPDVYEDTLPDRIPVPGGQAIDHLVNTVNGQPTRVTSQASLYSRDPNPVMRHLGGMVDDIKQLEANVEARLDAFEARHRGDVPSERYRRTAVNVEQAKYERRAVFTNMVTRYCLAERKKGRPGLTYAQAEAECKALAGKA